MRRRMVLTKAFGSVLRRARTDADLSQERLGLLADLHPTYISQLERGLKSPSLEVIAALARVLKQKPHTLVQAAEERAS